MIAANKGLISKNRKFHIWQPQWKTLGNYRTCSCLDQSKINLPGKKIQCHISLSNKKTWHFSATTVLFNIFYYTVVPSSVESWGNKTHFKDHLKDSKNFNKAISVPIQYSKG